MTYYISEVLYSSVPTAICQKLYMYIYTYVYMYMYIYMHPSIVIVEEPKCSAIVDYLNKLWNICEIEEDASEKNN